MKSTAFRVFAALSLGLGSFCAASCQSAHSGVVSTAPRAYLSFANYRPGLSVFVDGSLTPSLNNPENTIVEVTPGKHAIRVLDGGVVVVDRVVMLSDGQTQEIRIP